jgi:hypothetical protein
LPYEVQQFAHHFALSFGRIVPVALGDRQNGLDSLPTARTEHGRGRVADLMFLEGPPDDVQAIGYMLVLQLVQVVVQTSELLIIQQAIVQRSASSSPRSAVISIWRTESVMLRRSSCFSGSSSL